MKVKCTEIGSAGAAIRILQPLVDGIDLDELYKNRRVLFRVNRSGYGLRNVTKATGINFRIDKEEIVNPESGGTKTVDSIGFGIRTDNDGMLDMGKLADKFNDNRDGILEFIAHEARNQEERDRRRDERHRKCDVTQSLCDEGILDPIDDSVEETDSNYKLTLVLETDEELREAALFYKRIRDRRKMTPEEREIAQLRADHGVII